MLSWRKGHAVTSMVEEYLGEVEQCFKLWCEALEVYFEQGLGAGFDELVEKTHICESTCNDIRRGVQSALYEKTLIPESSGDVVYLLEALDQLPSTADRGLHTIQVELLVLPTPLTGKLREMVHLNRECADDVVRAVHMLFTRIGEVPAAVRDIDKKESALDRLEHEVIRSVFADAGIAPDQRILLRDFIRQVNSVSDFALQAADRITLLAVKRSV